MARQSRSPFGTDFSEDYRQPWVTLMIYGLGENVVLRLAGTVSTAQGMDLLILAVHYKPSDQGSSPGSRSAIRHKGARFLNGQPAQSRLSGAVSDHPALMRIRGGRACFVGMRALVSSCSSVSVLEPTHRESAGAAGSFGRFQ